MFSEGFEKAAAEVFKMKATPAKHGGRDGRKTYSIKKDGNTWSCTCPDFIYRRQAKGEECKHIQAHKKGVKPWELNKTANASLKDYRLEYWEDTPIENLGGDSAATKTIKKQFGNAMDVFTVTHKPTNQMVAVAHVATAQTEV